MKVIVADKISERGVKLLKEQDGWTTVLTTKETLEAEITDADALIVRSATKVTEHLLARAPKLRAVGRAGVGVDNINLEAATKRGLLVMSKLTEFPPGGLITRTPRFVAASKLILSTPTPARPTARSLGAPASRCSVTFVALRTINASASVISASSVSFVAGRLDDRPAPSTVSRLAH